MVTALDAATTDLLRTWRTRQRSEKLSAGPAWTNSGLVFTRPDESPLCPEWISQRFDLLITQHAAIRRRHDVERWRDPQIARRHRVSEAKVRAALAGGSLPPIRFHDLRHGAATLSLTAGVEMKVVSETLGHARSSFTADVYASVIPEVFKGPLRRPQPQSPAAPAPHRPPNAKPAAPRAE